MSPEEAKTRSKFLKELKTYFSSLSARGAKYLFLNIGELKNTFVITNGDYEMLTGYVPVLLSIHLATFKSQFYQDFVQFIQFLSDQPYIINISQFLKALRDLKKEDLVCRYDSAGNLYLYQGETLVVADAESKEEPTEESSTDDESDDEEGQISAPVEDDSPQTFVNLESCGQTVTNYHALAILTDVVLSMHHKEQLLHEDGIVPVTFEVPADMDCFTSNIYRLPCDLARFTDAQGLRVFDDEYEPIYLILIDGLDVPSLKEFVRKKADATMNIRVWRTGGGSLQHMAMYDDPSVSIKSARPFLQIYPFKQTKCRDRRNPNV